MKTKNKRLDLIKAIVASQPIGSQEELLTELAQKEIHVTQATLSRDLKQMKIAKAASMSGGYVYVLPNDVMYKRNTEHGHTEGLLQPGTGFVSLHFSGNLAVIKTRPGYASSLAYDIDNCECPDIIGTIAGDDTILLILRENSKRKAITDFMQSLGVQID
ncbi:MAG: arginine repressor [Prevotellaceae bacterium]|jgi:transcriptional regulator of arginine metabolism|nr:arginine repressor [Prevotellaceae bacterium]